MDNGTFVSFDEAAWLKENPRPDGNARNPDVVKWNSKKWRAKNREKVKEQNKAYREKDSSKLAQKEYQQEYAKNNDRSEYQKKYRSENRQALSDKKREYNERHPELKRANSARYRTFKMQRSPSWADQERINEIYESAKKAADETGIPHHVDHVIPLQGKNVSGLHHQDNLLIVPGAENLSKGNRFEPGDLPPRAGVRKSRAYLKKLKAAQEAAKRK